MKTKQVDRMNQIAMCVSEYCPTATVVGTALRPEFDTVGVITKAMNWADGENTFETPCLTVIHDEAFFNQLCQIASSTTEYHEVDLEEKAQIKWNKPQGGKQAYQLYLPILNKYGACQQDENLLTDIERAKIHLLIPVFAKIGDPICRTALETYHTWTPCHASSGGIMHFADRRDPAFRAQSCRLAMTDWLNPDPVVGSTRFKDSKLRAIFMDSLANYYREARLFHRMFSVWRELPFNHHYSDKQLEEIFAKSAASAHYHVTAYGGDYAGMDFHFGRGSAAVAIQILATVAGSLDYADEVIQKFTTMWDRMTVVVGDQVLQQLYHYLYSGLYPTHDLEGPSNYYMHVQTANDLHLLVDHTWEYKHWQVRIMVCGDDSVVLFNWETIHVPDRQALVSAFARRHAEVAAKYGQIMELSKVEISSDYVPFCKRRYFFKHVRGTTLTHSTSDGVAIPASKYSLIKTLNALYHPEHSPRFQSGWGWLVWMCTILDCANGMTKWSDIIDALARNMANDSRTVERVINPQGDESLDFATIMADWWFRQSFSTDFKSCRDFLKTSPSYQKLYRLVRQYAGLN